MNTSTLVWDKINNIANIDLITYLNIGYTVYILLLLNMYLDHRSFKLGTNLIWNQGEKYAMPLDDR